MKFLHIGVALALSSMLVANEKNGFFIGMEAGFTPSATNYANFLGREFTVPSTQKTRAFPLGLTLGYQYYFTQSQGISLQARAAYATYKTSKTQVSEPRPGYRNNNNMSFDININTEALHFGIDANYLFDFFATENHVLGLDAGVGLDFVYFLSTKHEWKNPHATINNSLGEYSSMALALGFGVHYYFKTHHQLGIKYRYTGHSMDTKISKDYKTPGSLDTETYKFVAATANLSSIVFSYTYKF